MSKRSIPSGPQLEYSLPCGGLPLKGSLEYSLPCGGLPLKGSLRRELWSPQTPDSIHKLTSSLFNTQTFPLSLSDAHIFPHAQGLFSSRLLSDTKTQTHTGFSSSIMDESHRNRVRLGGGSSLEASGRFPWRSSRHFLFTPLPLEKSSAVPTSQTIQRFWLWWWSALRNTLCIMQHLWCTKSLRTRDRAHRWNESDSDFDNSIIWR